MINDSSVKQLNPFEIKAEITALIAKLYDVKNFEDYEIHYKKLDLQNDKTIITKLLFKEFTNITPENEGIIKFLLKRYTEHETLVNHLWSIIKNNMTKNSTKIFALDFLREIDTEWTYDECEGYLNTDELADEDTRKLLDKAIINPEVQIDFLDFFQTLTIEDKIILLQSLRDDYSGDALANILIPVFLSQPDSDAGKEALSILGNSKSQLAYHALNDALDFVNSNIKPLVKKNLSILKLSGIREDNSKEFYTDLLSNSKPYRLNVTYPDGQGNQAMIFSRIDENFKVRFLGIVINDYYGIKDCFGFNELSKFECDTIIDRFYRDEKSLEITPEEFKTILFNAELISKKSQNWLMPYEYVCWKTLLFDIEIENKTIKTILDEKLQKEELTEDRFNAVLNGDFTAHWFMNADYSDEFEAFLAELNEKLKIGDNVDFDKTVDNNINKVFYPEEKIIWRERVLNSAYLKLATGNSTDASVLYNIYYDDNYFNALLKFIMKKSIYEYYFNMHYRNDTSIFEEDKSADIVSVIESKWVQ